MDYTVFYAEIAAWIQTANQNAVKMGFDSDEYWAWVFQSVGEFCNRYNNQELVIRQMTMLLCWLDDAWKKSKGVG